MTASDLAQYFLSKTGGKTGCVSNWINGDNLPTVEQFNKIIKILNLPIKTLEEAHREVIGTKITNATVYQKIGDKNEQGIQNITIPATNQAKKWNGWGTALKPAYEPIIVARKPMNMSVAQNVLTYGVGGINIDECRVETDDIRSGGYENKDNGSEGTLGWIKQNPHLQSSIKRNTHPTVKPVELMQYLVRLVSPKGTVDKPTLILDCFMGSGSIGKAVMFENRERDAHYHFIGVEMTDEYLPIAKK